MWVCNSRYVMVFRCGIGTCEPQSLQVKRALTLYSTVLKDVPGNRSEASFSDIGWGTKTQSYTRSIMKVSDGKFAQIINSAREYCNTANCSRQARLSHKGLTAGKVDKDDDWAMIVVSSDIEAESDGEGEPFPTWMHRILITHHDWTRIVSGGETV
jgi:hypothetical protein